MAKTKETRSAEINELWQRTSYLITHAQGLEAFGEMSAARHEWFSAAQWAEHLANLLWVQEVEDEAILQQVSAASCYAMAGAFDRAVVLLEALLNRPAVPAAWREETTTLLLRYRQSVMETKQQQVTATHSMQAANTLGGYLYAYVHAA